MIPLALHSHFSLLRGTGSCEVLCCRARELGYSRIGLTDINNLHGLFPFLQACRRHGLRPVVGAELAANGQRVFALVKNDTGYRNLCRALTTIHARSLPLADLALRDLRGLVLLTADPGLLRQWRDRELDVAAALCNRPTQAGTHLRRLARSLGLLAVAVADVFFLRPRDLDLYRLLRAIDSRSTLSRVALPGHVRDCWLAGPRAYRRRFAVWPDALRGAEQVAERCSFTGPDFGLVLPPWPHPRPDLTLRRLALRGAGHRYGFPLPAPVRQRLAHELDVIGRMGFFSYFLVVRDIVRPAARTCGRGSGAASLVAYCLGITNVCPLRHNLYFERFLNPGRRDAPDLDIDFPWDEREKVLRTVFDRFGVHAAMVCNLVTLQPRMAVRETARVYGLPEGEISRVTRAISGLHAAQTDNPDLADRIRALPRLRNIPLDDPWPAILEQAATISAIPRHLSVHPGGVVITPKPVSHYVPVQSSRGVPLMQWDKDSVEQAGLVKIDLLGNRSLAVIRDAAAMVRSHTALPPEHAWQPERDPATRRLIRRGETMGCFYIESPAMRLLQKKANRGDFDQLVILSSIIRPAAGGCIREYLRRLHGGSWRPLHPVLEGVLDETLGILVFQEDVSRVAARLGFSAAEADRLRKIMSKKDTIKTLARYRTRFMTAARAHGLDRDDSEELWAMMTSFDGYSFCKPHSASYARVSFQAAWLKAHFPAEFMAAVLANRGGYYSAFAYVSEARRLGLTILPPDVNRAGLEWSGRGHQLRVGLMGVRNLSLVTARRIVRERGEKNFVSLSDFLHRVTPAVDEARELIHAGGFDRLHPESGRGELFYQLARWQRFSGQPPRLFSFSSDHRPPPLPPDDPLDRLRGEYRALGFLCRFHPIVLFERQRTDACFYPAREIVRMPAGTRVCFLGWCISTKPVSTRTGQVMEFVSFEDETGLVECTFFPAVWRRHCHILRPGHPLILTGVVEEDFQVRTLRVERAALARPDREISVSVCRSIRKVV